MQIINRADVEMGPIVPPNNRLQNPQESYPNRWSKSETYSFLLGIYIRLTIISIPAFIGAAIVASSDDLRERLQEQTTALYVAVIGCIGITVGLPIASKIFSCTNRKSTPGFFLILLSGLNFLFFGLLEAELEGHTVFNISMGVMIVFILLLLVVVVQYERYVEQRWAIVLLFFVLSIIAFSTWKNESGLTWTVSGITCLYMFVVIFTTTLMTYGMHFSKLTQKDVQQGTLHAYLDFSLVVLFPILFLEDRNLEICFDEENE